MTATRLIVPLVHAARPLSAQAADAYAAGADMVELRVDLIQDVSAVEAFLAGPRDRPCILTIRSAAEGGAWDQDDAERIALFERLGLLQPGYIDVEWRTWQRSANLRQKIGLVCERAAGGEPPSMTARAKSQLILSLHDFQSMTPLEREWRELRAAPAHVFKLAVTPRDAADALQILRLVQEDSESERILAIGMGAAGVATRILAPCVGAFGSFAALDDQQATAPGQLTLAALRERYRWSQLGPSTIRFGVIGWPVGHSRSPELHNAAMAADGIDGVYVHLPVTPSDEAFAAFMDEGTRPEANFRGFSVTLPHKEHAARWLRTTYGAAALSESAASCGAVNTLGRADGGWWGDNTDAGGIQAALHDAAGARSSALVGSRALVLGAGGVARAALVALRALGCRLTVCNRTRARAETLAAQFGGDVIDWEARADVRPDLVVNCTSLGMAPQTEASPLDARALRGHEVVFDTIYTPAQTRLLRESAARGCLTISGLDLFVHQARLQYRRWHEHDLPATVVARFGQ